MIYRRGRGERETANKRSPVVKLPRRLGAHLRRWREMDRRASTKDRPITSVIHHGGEPLAGKIRTGFEGIVRDAGLSEEVTPHWLRHTCATWLLEAGVEPWEAAAYTGMSVAVLIKHYGHHMPGHQAAARKALGGRR
jgi:integrase